MRPSRSGTFPGEGGVEIHWQCWLPEGTPRAVVVIAHGVSEHSDRYAHVAERLTDDNYATYSLDHRGHGRSGGERAVIDRLRHAVEDIDALVRLARAEHPGLELFLLGHSMGGAIAVEYALAHQDQLDGLVLSAPATALEAASRLQLLAGRVLSAVAPRAGVFDVDSETISRDHEVVRAYDEDPLVYSGRLPARTVAELAGAIQTLPQRVVALRLPLLVMYGTGDRLVPNHGGRMVHDRSGSNDKLLIEYEGLYHEILNEPEQERVMDDLIDWLDAHG